MTTNINNTTPARPMLYFDGSGCETEQGFLSASFKPVLAHSLSNGNSTLVVKIDFGLDCPAIRSWIDDGRAEFYVNAECPSAYYRERWTFRDATASIDVPAERVRKQLDVCVGIVAAKGFQIHTDDRFAEPFRDLDLLFEKGDLIAIGGTTEFELENSGAAGLPVIVAKMPPESARPYEVDPTGNELVVYLREETYQTYNRLGAAVSPFVMLVQRAFTEALAAEHERAVSEALSGGEDFGDARIDASDRDWLRFVERALKSGVENDRGEALDLPDGVNSIEWDDVRSENSLPSVMDAFFGNIADAAFKELENGLQTDRKEDEV